MKKIFCVAFICLSALLSGISGAADSEVNVSTKGGLKVTSGDYVFKFGGRVQYDYNKSVLNGETDEDDFDLRRGRLFVSGDIGQNWAFKSQFNTNGDGVEDLYLRYKGWGKSVYVTIGNQTMPFGLERATSSKDISVLERTAFTELFSVGKAEGVQFSGQVGRNGVYGVGLFTDDQTDSDKGFSARYAWAPINANNQVLHFGLAYKDIADDAAVGLEVAAAAGSFHIQAEYADGDSVDDIVIENADGEEDVIGQRKVNQSGYYLQAGYILTGESRPYKGGKFKRVKPSAKSGAWEAVVRYEDGDGNYSDIELGKVDATAYTLGLNWYAHNNVRFGVNYTQGDDNDSGDDGSEFRVRFQLVF